MSHTGKCLCGSVSFTLENAPTETGACHCEMCRKWSGGIYLGVAVPQDQITFEGAENIGTFARAWTYPGQEDGWKMVSLAKLGSWFLLMLISFVLVALVQPVREPDE